jgi:hypothetical protein
MHTSIPNFLTFSIYISICPKENSGSQFLPKAFKIYFEGECRFDLLSKVILLSGTLLLSMYFLRDGTRNSSSLEVPDLFSLLVSPRNRFYHSLDPQVLAKIPRGPRKYQKYRKVVSSRLSRLVAHFWIFRLLMKGKFDAFAL